MARFRFWLLSSTALPDSDVTPPGSGPSLDFSSADNSQYLVLLYP